MTELARHSPVSKAFVSELDNLISSEYAPDIFSLPIDLNIPNLQATPLYATYSDPFAIYVLKVEIAGEPVKYISVYIGDGGVIVDRSDLTPDISTLLLETEEEWSEL